MMVHQRNQWILNYSGHGFIDSFDELYMIQVIWITDPAQDHPKDFFLLELCHLFSCQSKREQ